MTLVLVSVATLLASALMALVAYRRPGLSTGVGALGAVVGCALCLVVAVPALGAAGGVTVSVPWPAPTGALALGVDALSAFFLVPLGVLGVATAVYGRAYLLPYARRKWLGIPAAAFNTLLAAMILVVTARSTVLFLVAWEVMTLSSYVLVTLDDEGEEARRAGFVYLVAAHVGVACLTAMFLLLGDHAGDLGFVAFQAMPRPSPGFATLLFLLALVGFGVKAGLLPMHVWLPEAHAAAPSQVSALMSGVLVKMGIYGILRTTTLLPLAPWWGHLLVNLGLAGALLGIALALNQRDIKRVLAYSTVENVGLVVAGLGVAFWAASAGMPHVAALGVAGALLHVWNHALMKGLMFLGAGSVLHGAHTKDIERLGGLLRRMPVTGFLMLVGGVAIAGLPPMNGFVGEWLLYLGLMRGGAGQGGVSGLGALLGVGILSLVGGMAALCFVRLVGLALLGEPRASGAAAAHESSPWMVGPMVALALALVLAALFPAVLVSSMTGVVGQLLGAAVAGELATITPTLQTLGLVNGALWAALGVGAGCWDYLGRRAAPPVGTWDCGYAAPSARMQYTGRSFAEMFRERLLPGVLRARLQRQGSQALFPSDGSMACDDTDPLMHRVFTPFFSGWGDRFARLRWLQQGALNIYLLYIMVVLLAAFGWVSWRGGMAP